MSKYPMNHYLPTGVLSASDPIEALNVPEPVEASNGTTAPRKRKLSAFSNELLSVDQETDSAVIRITNSGDPIKGVQKVTDVLLDFDAAADHLARLEGTKKPALMYIRMSGNSPAVVKSHKGVTGNLLKQRYVPTLHEAQTLPNPKITALNGIWTDCRGCNAIPTPQWSFLTPRVSYDYGKETYVGWTPEREAILYDFDEFDAAAILSVEDINRGYGPDLRDHLVALLHRAVESLRPHMETPTFKGKDPKLLARDILTTAGRRELGLALPRGVRMGKSKRSKRW